MGTSTSTPAARTSRRGAAVMLVLLGLIGVFACLVVTIIQIQTNESLFMHEPAALSTPHWQTLTQPYDLIAGNLSNAMTKAVIWSWGSELFYLFCIFGFDMAMHSVRTTWNKLVPVFIFVAILIIGYNIYTDYQYGPTGFWTQLGFALIVQVIVVFFGVIGAGFIEHGLTGR